MKQINLFRTIFFILLLCDVVTAKAHDFMAGGIYYNITDNNKRTVEVVYRGSYSNQYDEYSGSVIVPELVSYNGNIYTVTSIGKDAFFQCLNLASITIPNSVTNIGDFAFQCCSGLTSITIPNSVTSIGNLAFASCSGLNSVIIGNSVTSIGNYAFSGCSGLASITIGNSVTSIGFEAFSDCSGLGSIIVYPGNTKYDSRDNCNAIIETANNTLIVGCRNTVIPNGITSIGMRAFDGCSGLTSIIIPSSVASIGKEAFYDCSGLKTVINLSNLKFSVGSTDYGYITYYADKVISAEIENDFIFSVVNGVNTLIGYLDHETDLTLPVDYKGASYSIGEKAFNGNKTITSITIPNNVTNIGYGAFYGCSALTSVTIGSNVTSIGESAFAYCYNIIDIKLMAEKPIRSNANIFSNAVYDNATLYVPTGAKSLYEKREPWNMFFNMQEIDYTGIEDINAENGNVKTIYDLHGHRVENPTGGIYIVNGKKIFIK